MRQCVKWTVIFKTRNSKRTCYGPVDFLQEVYA